MNKFARLARLCLGAGFVALLAACAHPINIEARQLPTRDDGNLVAKKVGYVITDADRAKEVTTPGGGGDKVSYYPYRDMEQGLRAALRSVYSDVSALKTQNDPLVKDAGLSYIFTPQIITNSSSPSPFTWPPTKFHVEVSCTVTDPQGTTVAVVKADGDGAAEFSEFKSDFSLSARRAVTQVVENLAKEIRGNEKLH